MNNFKIEPNQKERHFFNDGTLSNDLFFGHWYNKDKIAKDYLIFIVVRNPWDKFVSSWKYLQKYKNKNIQWVLNNLPKQNEKDCFYLEKDVDLKAIFPSKLLRSLDYCHMLRPQISTLLDKSGNFVPDYILRFEYLQEDFSKMCKIIGKKDDKLQVFNKSSHRNYAEYYNEELKLKVHKLFKRDVNYFGYKFGKNDFNYKKFENKLFL